MYIGGDRVKKNHRGWYGAPPNSFAEVLANSRLVVPAQPVDATPSNQLMRQYFSLENRSVRLHSITPSQDGLTLESAFATTLSS